MEKLTNLAAARKASGLHQSELSEKAKISLYTLRSAEKDNDKLTLGDLRKIVPHLNSISVSLLKEQVDDIFLNK